MRNHLIKKHEAKYITNRKKRNVGSDYQIDVKTFYSFEHVIIKTPKEKKGEEKQFVIEHQKCTEKSFFKWSLNVFNKENARI